MSDEDGIFYFSNGTFNQDDDGKLLIEKYKFVGMCGDKLREKLLENQMIDMLNVDFHNFKNCVYIDGSDTSKTNIVKGAEDYFFEVSAAAHIIKNHSFHKTRIYKAETPFMIAHKFYNGNFPGLMRDCQEYKTALSEIENYDHDIIIMDGSAYTGSSWWNKRNDYGLREDASLYFDDSKFVEGIEKKLKPLYDTLMNYADEKIVIFLPKKSVIKRLMTTFLDVVDLEDDFLNDQNDIGLLTGKLRVGEYIIYENQIFDDSPQRHRQIMSEFLNVIFQVSEGSEPILFNIHKHWRDKIPNILYMFSTQYDHRYRMLRPMSLADKAARRVVNTIDLRALYNKYEKAALKYIKNNPGLERGIKQKLFLKFRKYRER